MVVQPLLLISKGVVVCQGDPLLPSLFITVLELLPISVRNTVTTKYCKMY